MVRRSLELLGLELGWIGSSKLCWIRIEVCDCVELREKTKNK